MGWGVRGVKTEVMGLGGEHGGGGGGLTELIM